MKKILLFCLIFSLNNQLHAINSTLLKTCQSVLYSCFNETFFDGNTYNNCTGNFEECFKEVFNTNPIWPEECFLAQAEWNNFYISIGAFFGILAFNNIAFPIASKTSAWVITKCIQSDPARRPLMFRLGRLCSVFFDTDQNNVVTATELINPQAFITFAGLSIPIYYVFNAITQQAECDFAKATLTCLNPFLDDNDFCHGN